MVSATSEISGTLLIIPSGSSATETVPDPALYFSNSGTFAKRPGYDVNHFLIPLSPKNTFTEVSLISFLFASPVTSNPECPITIGNFFISLAAIDSFEGSLLNSFANFGFLDIKSFDNRSGDVLSFSAKRTSSPRTNIPESFDLLNKSAKTVLGQGH